MCSDTKLKITDTLRTLMQERPLEKITVKDIMDGANMKRQSFYYHFQDIFDVLEWEINRCLFLPLSQTSCQSLEEWCDCALLLLDEERNFSRKVVQALGRERTARLMTPVVRGQVIFQLFGLKPGCPPRTEQERSATEFITYAFVNFFIDVILSREQLYSDRSRRRIRAACSTAEILRPHPGQAASPQSVRVETNRVLPA